MSPILRERRLVLIPLLCVMVAIRLRNSALMSDRSLLLTRKRLRPVVLRTRRRRGNLSRKIRKFRSLLSLVPCRKKVLSCTTLVRPFRLVRQLNDRLKKARLKRRLLWKYRFRVLTRWFVVRRQRNLRSLMALATRVRCLVNLCSLLAALAGVVLILLVMLLRLITMAPRLLWLLCRYLSALICRI